jgi:hypothetical protein
MIGLAGLVVVVCILVNVLTKRMSQARAGLVGRRLSASVSGRDFPGHSNHALPARRTEAWLAIRTRNTALVQAALGIQHAAPCSWTEGVLARHRLFIAPPINGWTLVFSNGLPDPDDDVDACYCFLRDLSRKVGHVQYFQADPLLQRHAWARVESGRVLRAYAWAGMTLWNQGVKTDDEIELGMKCHPYGETIGGDEWAAADQILANVRRVPLLARRWSLDPAEIDPRLLFRATGVVGQSSRLF